jgi:rare lipoprotein A
MVYRFFHIRVLFRTLSSLIFFYALLSLTGCGSIPDGAPHYYENVNNIPNPVVRPLKKSIYGNPSSYVVHGKRYFVLPSAVGYRQTGIASWYGTKFHGKLTSTREPYNLYAMTAASPILPLPCFVRVTNLNNHRSVIVKVNDRGPFEDHRIIDLSYAAASKLDMLQRGTAPVEVVALTPGSMQSYDHSNDVVASPAYVIQTIQTKQAQTQNNSNHLMTQPASGLFIQIAAYSILDNAKATQQKIQQHISYPVVIQTTLKNNQTIYLVKIGPLNNEEQVNSVRDALRNMTL